MIQNKDMQKTVKFDQHIVLNYGSPLPATDRLKGNFPVYGSNGVVGHHDQFLIQGPGIIVGRKGTIGAVVWSESSFWPIDTTYYITADESVDLRWLYYKLQTLGLQKMNMAGGVPGLNRNEVYNLKISIPSRQVQQKIAEILSKVDEEIEKVDHAIEKTEQLKNGLMQDLLTKGIGHSKFKKTELGEIPEEWKVVKLREKTVGIQYGFTESSSNQNIGPKFLRITDIVDGNVNWDSVPYCECPEEQINKYLLKNEDIVFARTGATTGKSFYVQNPLFAVFASYLIRVILDQKTGFVSKFVYYFFQSDKYWKQIKSSISGSAQGGFNASKLGDLKLPFPPLSEQLQISSILSSIDDRMAISKKVKSKLGQLKEGLMQNLFNN
ncbi:MAG: restriction endonuclease subunit S [Candidatus Gracilibacteria bacterium]